MDDSTAKWKCAGYLLALTVTLSLLLLSYFSSATDLSSTRITIDTETICNSVRPEMCIHPPVTNYTDCMQALDFHSCQSSLLAWEEDFNRDCAEPIRQYLYCDKPAKCEEMKKELEHCEEQIQRPEWFPLPKMPAADWLDR